MSSTPPPQTTLYSLYVHYMRKCNAESQKMSAKGFNFREDDSVLHSRSYYSYVSCFVGNLFLETVLHRRMEKIKYCEL